METSITFYHLHNGTSTPNLEHAQRMWHKFNGYKTLVRETIPQKWPLKRNLHSKEQFTRSILEHRARKAGNRNLHSNIRIKSSN